MENKSFVLLQEDIKASKMILCQTIQNFAEFIRDCSQFLVISSDCDAYFITIVRLKRNNRSLWELSSSTGHRINSDFFIGIDSRY